MSTKHYERREIHEIPKDDNDDLYNSHVTNAVLGCVPGGRKAFGDFVPG